MYKSGEEFTKGLVLEKHICMSFIGFYKTNIERDISYLGCL